MKKKWKKLTAALLCGVMLCANAGLEQAIQVQAAENAEVREDPDMQEGIGIPTDAESDEDSRDEDGTTVDDSNGGGEPGEEADTAEREEEKADAGGVSEVGNDLIEPQENIDGASTVVLSGNCGVNGDDVKFVLDSDGVLTISGSGEMASYSYSSRASWYDQASSIKEVQIGENITNIGRYAFYECKNLTKITIPTSVTEIESDAFSYCNALLEIHIPDSVNFIGSSAFSNCSKLKAIEIPAGIKEIQYMTFWYCNDLESVTIPSGLKSIGRSAFYKCGLLSNIVYAGDKEQWNNIVIGSNNECLKNAYENSGIEDEDNYIITGSEILINNIDDLTSVATSVNSGADDYSGKILRFTSDIDLSDTIWTPIGTKQWPFKGSIDGNSHVVSGLKRVQVSSGTDYGLFGCISVINNTKICNLSVNNVDVDATCGTYGTIAGTIIFESNAPLIVSNCSVSGKVLLKAQKAEWSRVNAGGFFGKIDQTYNNNIYFSGLQSTLSVITEQGEDNGKKLYVGGICGYMQPQKYKNFTLKIKKCKIDANISGKATTYTTNNSYVGGLLGYLDYNNTAIGACMLIDQSYFNGTIEASSGGSYGGGFVGRGTGAWLKVQNSYVCGEIKISTGNLSHGAGGVGGDLGFHSFEMINCYINASVSGSSSHSIIGDRVSGSDFSLSFDSVYVNKDKCSYRGYEVYTASGYKYNIVGDITQISSEQLCQKETFIGWDFINVWKMGADSPELKFVSPGVTGEDIIQGKCGEDLTWIIEEKDGWTVLNITGKGDMYDFEYAPWYKNRNDIKKIIIADGVISIGNAAFKELENLKEVVIPQSIIKIGDDAFFKCNDLGILYGSVENDWNLITIGNNNKPLYETFRIEFRHNVIFDLGYGSDSQYMISMTNFENTVKRPVDPEREGYVFYGWAEENDNGRVFICKNNAGGTEDFDQFQKYPFLSDTILHAQWGKITSLDVFSFCNNYDPFCYKNAKDGEGYHYEINAKYWRRFLLGLPDPVSLVYAIVLKAKEWTGSCFGMSAVVALKNAGIIKDDNSSKLADLKLPINTEGDSDASDLESFINFYHIQQGMVLAALDMAIDKISGSESKRLEELINAQKKSQNPVIVSISVSEKADAEKTNAHAIVAYGLTTDIKEDKNIYSFKVYDPSAGAKYEYEPRFEYCVKVEEKDGIYSPLKKSAEYSYDELNYFLCADWKTIKWANCCSAGEVYSKWGFLFDFPSIPSSVSDDAKLYNRNSSSDTGKEKNEVTILRTNYDSFIITNGVESADIVKRNTVSGSLNICFLGAVGNAFAGSESYQEYLFAILNEENRDIQYIITPKENQDTYTTILYNDSDKGYLASLECDDIGEYIFSNSGTVQTNFTNDTYQAITLARNNTQLIWDGIKLEFAGQGCVAELNNKDASVVPKKDVSIDVTIYEGIDQIEFDSVNTSTNGIMVTEKDSSVVIMDKDEIIDSKILKHTVFFDFGDEDNDFLVRTVDNGGKLESPEIPEREGLVFEGWFKDAKLTEKWNFDEDVVTSSFTLHSKWKEKNEAEDVIPVTEVTLNKNTIDIEEGTSFVLTAVVSPFNATDKQVDWISSDTDVATVTDGIVIAKAAGTTTITAIAGEKSAACIVTVTEKSSQDPGTEDEKTEYIITASNQADGSIAPNGDVKVAKGGSQKFIFTADEGYKIDDIKVDGKSIGAVSEYCFENVSGNHTIEAIFSENSNSTVEKIILSQAEVTIKEGTTVLLEATIVPDNVVNGHLTWNSSNNDVASVDGQGLVTAKLPGTSIITVTAGEASASCMVTVVTQGQNEDPGDSDKVVYIITFDLQGHGVGLAEYLNYTNIKPGDKIVEPTSPQDENYKFVGWYKDAECTLPWDFEKDAVQSDITLYAGWQKEDAGDLDDPDIGDTDDDTEKIHPGDLPSDGHIPAGLWIANLKDSYLYTGKAIKPAVRVYDHDRRLKAGRDYTVSYKNNTKANGTSQSSKTPVVVVKGKGEYAGTETAEFNILPVDLNTLTAEYMTIAYNKKEQKKVPALYYNGKKLSRNRDFTVSWPDQGADAYKGPGVYRIELIGKGNFTGTKSIQFTITDKNLIGKAKVGKIAPLSYTGEAQEPEFTVTLKGAPLVKGTDYEVEYTDNVSAGTATAVLTGINQYAGTKKVNFKITGTSLKGLSVTGLEDRAYNGTAQISSVKVTLNGKALAEHEDYEVSYSKNVNAGKAAVTVRGIHAYTGTVKKTFRITPYDLDGMKEQLKGTISAKYVKGGSRPMPELVFADKKLTAGKDYTISYKNNKAVTASGGKTPVMVIKGKGNFRGTLTKEFTITDKALDDAEAPVTLALVDVPFSDKAGKCMSRPILTDADGKKLTAGKDYGNVVYTLEDGSILSEKDRPDAGTRVHVSVEGKGAYTGKLTGTYQVTVSDFSKAKIHVVAKAYTGRAITLEPGDVTVKIGGAALKAGEDYEIIAGSYANNIKRGKATVSIKGKGNYGGIKTVKFKITARQFAWFWRLFK